MKISNLRSQISNSENPVGFFDSGIGGTCILNAFEKLCPDEETVYIADSKNCPYGNKPAEEIIRLSEANVKKLLRKNCKMIVVACNTATAAAIDYLRAKYPEVPFVGLEPAVKPAAGMCNLYRMNGKKSRRYYCVCVPERILLFLNSSKYITRF